MDCGLAGEGVGTRSLNDTTDCHLSPYLGERKKLGNGLQEFEVPEGLRICTPREHQMFADLYMSRVYRL